MRIIITEEMRFRQKVVEYAIKHKNNEKAAREDMIQVGKCKDGEKNIMEQ